MIKIKVNGVAEVSNKLGKFRLAEVFRPPMERGLARLQSRMAYYPPAPASSTYKRTGTYGRTFRTTVEGMRGALTNNTTYAPLVGDAQEQTAAHRATGWVTDEVAVEKELPAIEADFKQTVETALKID